MTKKVKVVLVANNGVFKDLINDLINKQELNKFEKLFFVSMTETQITITEKVKTEVSKKEWEFLFEFLDLKTKDLCFYQKIEYN